jgi:RNA-directed DNA polymerase
MAEAFSAAGFGKRPKEESLRKFKDTIRAKACWNHRPSLNGTVEDSNRILRGWIGYFKLSHKDTFPSLDGWLRMRLRSILRRRQKQRSRRRGRDHQL